MAPLADRIGSRMLLHAVGRPLPSLAVSSRALWTVGLSLVGVALVLAVVGVAEPLALALGFVGGVVNIAAAVVGAARRR